MWYVKMIKLIKRIFGLKFGNRQMRVIPLSEFTRGWFIGNFEPSVLKTSKFEVGVFKHSKGEDWPAHYHRSHDEYNVLVTGKMSIYGTIIEPESVFVVPKMLLFFSSSGVTGFIFVFTPYVFLLLYNHILCFATFLFHQSDFLKN